MAITGRTLADPAERARAIAFSKQWIDVAVAIGSPSVRTSISQAKDSNLTSATGESLRQVVEHAASKNVAVHLENDNPVSEDPFLLVQVIDKVNRPVAARAAGLWQYPECA